MAKAKPRQGWITALDIGSSKICCMIGRVVDEGDIEIHAVGHHASAGIRSGAVIDMEYAESAIRAAVAAAEAQIDDQIRDVVINVSCGRPESKIVKVDMPLNGHAVSETDLRTMLEGARQNLFGPDRDLILSAPVGFVIDDNDGIAEPVGMYGDTISVTVHHIHAAYGPLRNLTTVVHRGHLDITGRLVSSHASGLACLAEDERDLGVILIDMGAGTTSIAVFRQKQLVHVDCLQVGGGHVTNDIARGLSTPLAQAERLKTLYGSTMSTPSDERENVKVQLVGEHGEQSSETQVPRAELVRIIQPRLEETFEMVRSKLEAIGAERFGIRRVVLTGGASQLQGVRDLAGMVLDRQIRIGRPQGVRGLPDAAAGPAFSTCVGLLRSVVDGRRDWQKQPARSAGPASGNGKLGHLTAWLRKNF